MSACCAPQMSCCSTGCSTGCNTGCSTGCGGCGVSCNLPTGIKCRPRLQFNKIYHIPTSNCCQQTKHCNVLNVGQNQCNSGCGGCGVTSGCCSTTTCAPQPTCAPVCAPQVSCCTTNCAPQMSCNSGCNTCNTGCNTCNTGCGRKCSLPTSRTMPMAGCYPKYTGPGCHPAYGACGASMGYNYGGDCQSGGMRYASCNSCSTYSGCSTNCSSC